MYESTIAVAVLEQDSTRADQACAIVDGLVEHGVLGHGGLVLVDARLTTCMSLAFACALLERIDAAGASRIVLLGSRSIRSGFRSTACRRREQSAAVMVPASVDDLPAFLSSAQLEEFLQCEMQAQADAGLLGDGHDAGHDVNHEAEHQALLRSIRSMPAHAMPEQSCLVSAGARA